MAKVTTLTGHTLRVLYLAISPDGETIVTVRPANTHTHTHTHTHPDTHTRARARETMVMAHPAACPAKDRIPFPHTPPGLPCCSSALRARAMRRYAFGASSPAQSRRAVRCTTPTCCRRAARTSARRHVMSITRTTRSLSPHWDVRWKSNSKSAANYCHGFCAGQSTVPGRVKNAESEVSGESNPRLVY